MNYLTGNTIASRLFEQQPDYVMNNPEDTEDKPQNETPENIVNNALERMKSGAVVKEQRISNAKIALISAVVIAAFTAYASYDFVYRKPSSETTASGSTVVTIKQSRDGSYLTKGKVNGQQMNFVVDTGATSVVIPLDLAREMGLPLGVEITTRTANGFGTAYLTRLKSVTLGGITLKNIEATATAGLTGDEALLGMTFLRKVKLEQEDGIMTITRK